MVGADMAQGGSVFDLRITFCQERHIRRLPIVLNVEAVAPPDRIGRDFRDERSERPQFHVSRA
jgi:hypothetical protein